MSQVRNRRDSIKKQSTTKNQWTKQKPKLQQPQKVQPATTVARNLMRDFTQVQNKNNLTNKERKQLEQSIDLTSNQSQYSEISVSKDISQYSNNTQMNEMQEENLGSFQLPKSYILAMKGLQEAVQSRDKQIRKFKKVVKQQTSQFEECTAIKNEEIKLKLNVQSKLNESILENKFLKEIITDLKSQVSEQLKLKIQVENQLKLVNIQIDKYSSEIQRWKRDYQSIINEKQNIRKELNRVTAYMDQRKAQYDETIRKRNEEYSIIFSQTSSLKLQNSKVKDQHEKDKSQILILRNQIIVLSESLAIQQEKLKTQTLLFQKNQLDKMQFQIAANRQMLKQITFNKNQLHNSLKNNGQTPQQTVNIFQQKPRALQANSQQVKPKQNYNTSFDQRSSFQNHQPTPKIERSISRLRQTNDSEHPQRRELVGQMRELMRHEKELVSLNYQMQVLEKGMMSQNSISKREQMQKTYSKLRKNIERKEIQVKELKYFLDNPLRGIK